MVTRLSDRVRGWLKQLRALIRKDAVERELDEELAFHLRMEEERNRRSGLPEGDARRLAHVAFGGIERFKEEVRQARRSRPLEDLAADARYAVRTLLKTPGFTVAAVLTLALGIGGTTAVFSIVRAVLLEPLPYGEAGQLVRLYQYDVETPDEPGYVTAPHFLDYRANASSFGSLATLYTYAETGGDLMVGGRPERVRVLPVSADYFRVLRVEPVRGRTFTREEETGAPLAIISEGLARRLGGSAPSADALGAVAGPVEIIRLDGMTRTVVGVMPAGFEDPIAGRVDVWIPQDLADDADNPENHFLTVIGRLAPDVTPERARQEMSALDDALAEKYPDAADNARFRLIPLHEDLVVHAKPTLLLLLGAVALVLLIACVNVANLLMVRSLGRTRELAVRSALGARQGRISRQLLTESLLLATVGGAAGIGVAIFGVDALLAVGRDAIPRATEVGVDLGVLGFAAAVTIATGLAFGLTPALRLARAAPAGPLREVARGASAGAGYGRMRGALVTAQVGLALVLLVGAFVLAASMHRLRSVDLGVETGGILTFELNLPAGRYDAGARAAFHREMTRRLATLPGVTHAAATSRLPATGSYHSWGTRPLTGPLVGDPERWIPGEQRVVEGDYFTALGIPLLEGRVFDSRDGPDSAPVAVLSRSAARELFPGVSALGQRTRAGGVERTVIGVVADVALDAEGEPAPYQYHAHAQFADNRNWSLTYIVATEGDAAALTPSVRRAVSALDSQLVVHRPATLDQVLGRGRSQRRFAFVLTAVFAALALTLAVVGLYGVLAYSVSQRTREIGIRLALGAEPRRIARSVLRHGLLLTALGLALGTLGALALGRALSALVYRTDPTDPRLIAAAAVVLLGAAIGAALVPTLRATRVPPTVALAEE